jgi:hypothetical protein
METGKMTQEATVETETALLLDFYRQMLEL